LIVPYAWLSSLPQTSGQGTSMVQEIAVKLSAGDGLGYLLRLLTYPLENLFWLSPVALLAVYLLLRKRVTQAEPERGNFRTALFIAGLSILPYWLAPQGGIRYLLPVYPLIALICARIIWRAGDPARRLALNWFAAAIAFKFLFALVLYPYYQHHYRGENYVTTAHQIAARTAGYPLYGRDLRSIGENIIGQIDLDRLPLEPVKLPPASWDNGFWLGMTPDELPGTLVEKYTVAKDDLYLICRGAACQAAQSRGVFPVNEPLADR
ncbi:MAG: hypothetical protein PHF75_05035, partial [Gallionella sp.]|nr:hypothetical protein [Gallionella sp.]